MNAKLKIFQALKITWWQDCPPGSAFMAKNFNSPIMASSKKLKSMGNRQHNFDTFYAGILSLVKKCGHGLNLPLC